MAGIGRKGSAGALLAVALVWGCGGDGEGATDPPQNPTLQISVTPASLSVASGASAQITVNVTRGGGFTGAVNLSVEGLPAGVTANTASVASGAGSGTLTLTAAAGAAPGTATLTVRGQGPGVSAATATVALTVTAPPQVGSYTLSLSPAALSVQQGQSGTVAVTLARTDFQGAVTLAVTGTPAGVSASVDPSNVTGNEAVLTIQAGGGATVGAATLTVTGTAAGLDNRTATLALTVTEASGGGPGNVTWSFCGETGLPLWVAYQDGNGPWTRVQGAGHVYSFQVDSDRAGVAFVTGEEDFTQLNVFYQTRVESIDYGSAQCPVTGELKSVNGSVSGLQQTQLAFVALGGASANTSGFEGGGFTLENVSPGPQDLVAGRVTIDLGTGALTQDRIIIRRDVDVPDGGTLAPLDFGTEGFSPETAGATVNGLAAGEQTVAVSALVTGGESGTLAPFLNFQFSGSTLTYAGVPADRLAPGDLHWLNVVATVPAQGAGVRPPDTRQVAQVFREVGDRSLTLGPAMTMPTVTSAGSAGGNVRLRSQYAIQPAEYNRWWFFSYQQQDRGVGVTIGASRGWQGPSNSLDLTLPDFSGVSGWNTAWGLASGMATVWTGTATGWAGAGGVIFPGFEEGTVLLSATRSGTMVP